MSYLLLYGHNLLLLLDALLHSRKRQIVLRRRLAKFTNVVSNAQTKLVRDCNSLLRSVCVLVYHRTLLQVPAALLAKGSGVGISKHFVEAGKASLGDNCPIGLPVADGVLVEGVGVFCLLAS